MLKTLDNFVIGESGVVCKVEGERTIRRRLYDMGITHGAEIYLRKSEASLITLEVNNA